MRYVRYAFWAILGIGLLTTALANRQQVTLNLVPDELATFLGWSYSLTLPLFLIIFAGIVAGLLIGFIWEWLREYKHRAQASQERRERQRLQREMEKLKAPEPGSGDDILAILDESQTAR